MIRILNYGELSYEEIFAREEIKNNVAGIVTDIIDTVRREGDAALFAYNKKFDGCDLVALLLRRAAVPNSPRVRRSALPYRAMDGDRRGRVYSTQGREGAYFRCLARNSCRKGHK